MTAVVGILNKYAVAIAADSAVTLGGNGGRKILNKANKVFTLSKYHPVGVMIYNSATFMGTPWETIIKVYRQNLKDKSFRTLKEYQLDFIEFLHKKNFYADNDSQLGVLESFIYGIIASNITKVKNEHLIYLHNRNKANHDHFVTKFELQISEFLRQWSSNMNYCDEYDGYTFEEFERYSAGLFTKLINEGFINFGITLTSDIIEKLKKCAFAVLIVKETYTNYTGLIFTGFGEDEIYPSLIPVNISMVVDNRLKYFIDEDNVASISNLNSGAVRPFAQTDVIETILSGIDPELENIFSTNFDVLFREYNKTIVANIPPENELLRKQIESLDTRPMLEKYSELNRQIKLQKFINPLMMAVSSLSKEDLSEMAESLIYLTYLKRRITNAEESVGGPVDVAVISKGDGFVWIKRKHYFAPELNSHFLQNYLKK